MKLLFAAMVLVHMVHSAVYHVREEREELTPARRRWMTANQLAVFALAAYFAYDLGVFTRALWSPLAVGGGLVLGHVIFSASLLVTHRSAGDAWSQLCEVPSLWRFAKEHPYVLSKFFYVALSEEVIWRAVAQPLAIDAFGFWAGIGAVALGFSLVHEHFLRNSTVVSLEFVAFSLALGLLYHATGWLSLVILVHMVRDVEIAYLEYLIKVNELGDEAQANEAIEEEYRPERLRGSYGQ